MCHYCGCRQLPLIRDYIAEHERALASADAALRAADAGRLDEARGHLEAYGAELRSHWAGEEAGIFVVMSARDQRYADYIAPLVQDHRDLDAYLATVDLASEEGRRAFRVSVQELTEHISKEEDGLFPATLVELDGREWDAAIVAWQEAHPGEDLLPDA